MKNSRHTLSTYTDIPEGNTLNTTLREQFPFAIICSPICIKSRKYWHSYSFKNYHSTKSLDFTWSWGVKLLKNQHQISYKQKLKFLARIAHDIAQKKIVDVYSDLLSEELYTIWLWLMFQVPRLPFLQSYKKGGRKDFCIKENHKH